jgi:hypothetical protein
MQTSKAIQSQFLTLPALLILLVITGINAIAQDRLPSMPGYDQYKKMSTEIRGAVKNDWRFLDWNADGKTFNYMKGAKTFTYTIASGKSVESTAGKIRNERRSESGAWQAIYFSHFSRWETESIL